MVSEIATRYDAASVAMFAVQPASPKDARTVPETSEPTAAVALFAIARSAVAPARSAGRKDDSWKARHVDADPYMSPALTARRLAARAGSDATPAMSANGSEKS